MQKWERVSSTAPSLLIVVVKEPGKNFLLHAFLIFLFGLALMN